MVDPLRTPKRIAVAGCWHGNRRWAVDALTRVLRRNADVVVHTGDFGILDDYGGYRYLEAIDRVGLPVLFVDGNHENHPWLLDQPVGENGLRQLSAMVWHIPRGFRWTWGGMRFLGCGGAHSVDRHHRVLGESWWMEEQISDADVAACGVDQVDVLVSHDCPSGVVIPTIDDRAVAPRWIPETALIQAHAHRQQLRRVADAVTPAAIWHGHYHTLHAQRTRMPWGEVSVVGLDREESRLDRNMRLFDMAEIQRLRS